MSAKHTATFTIKIDADALIDAVMGNYPEASSPSLRCVAYDYDRCRFEFWDCEVTPETREKSVVEPKVETLELRFGAPVEDAVVYHLTRAKLRVGLQNMLDRLARGELKGIAAYLLQDVTDPGNWDSDAADALVQCAIYGEVIYG